MKADNVDENISFICVSLKIIHRFIYHSMVKLLGQTISQLAQVFAHKRLLQAIGYARWKIDVLNQAANEETHFQGKE